MKTNEILEMLDDKSFLDKIYQFSYHRCSTSFEAEDLCSDIILAILSAVQKQNSIENFYAFAWLVARRFYADYCEKRNRTCQMINIENSELPFVSKENELNDFIEETDMQKQLQEILSEIAFLSKAYREVMVLYYIDGMKIRDIAESLNISETTVKQRLFSARNTVRKEVKSMNNRNLSLKPVRFAIWGTGNPYGNDPCAKTERVFSQNLIYLCKNKPKSAKELSEELCIPMPYIEEELEIQCRGENGSYGMLRKLDNGKYTINILLADYEEYRQANRIYEKHLSSFCRILKINLEKNKEKILAFPYLSTQNDLHYILWSFIPKTLWDFEQKINKRIAEKYFPNVTPVDRKYSCVAVALTDGQKPISDLYESDGIDAAAVGGYKSVFIANLYGKRINKHFDCYHNFSHDAELLMILKAIGGLSIDSLTEAEKEIAAKAIECDYLRKLGNIIEPKIVVIEKQSAADFYNLAFDFNKDMEAMIEEIAEELADFIQKHIPEHLINEYQIYTQLITGTRMLSAVIEECIKDRVLSAPEKPMGAEGMLMIVEK